MHDTDSFRRFRPQQSTSAATTPAAPPSEGAAEMARDLKSALPPASPATRRPKRSGSSVKRFGEEYAQESKKDLEFWFIV